MSFKNAYIFYILSDTDNLRYHCNEIQRCEHKAKLNAEEKPSECYYLDGRFKHFLLKEKQRNQFLFLKMQIKSPLRCFILNILIDFKRFNNVREIMMCSI